MSRVLGWLKRPFAAFAAWWRRIGWPTRIATVVATLVVAPLILVTVAYLLPTRTAVALGQPLLAWLSDAPPLPSDLEPVTERSVLLAADGSELATLFGDVNRVKVTLDEIPDVVVDALLAAEDDAFYSHPGINHRAIMRAAFVNVTSGRVEQGGSTLTQQLVKNVYLDPSQTVRRKATEAWYALELEDRLTKDEILERYLNEAYFGQSAYGVEAAAQLYFNKPAKDLDVAEAALLVGVIPSPSTQNPVDDRGEALAARDRVLQRMVDTGRLDEEQANAATGRGAGLDVTPPPPPKEPFFVAHVRDLLLHDEQFDDLLGTDPEPRERLIDTGGLTVHTTLVPRLQNLANDAIDEVMGDPAGSPLATLTTVDPATGAVQAMAVGPQSWGRCKQRKRNCPNTMVNPTVPGLGGTGRQPGSAFKPFVLATALEEGVPPGWEERTNAGKAIPGCDDNGKPYKPQNYSLDPGVKDMKAAVEVSNNVYHAKLIGMLEPPLVVETAEKTGLVGGRLPEQCSVALGSGSAYPLAMASAFATFANEGQHCVPMAVTRIELGAAAGGAEDFEPDCTRRFDGKLAAVVNDLLQAPVESGTGTAAQLDRPVAGKTGTTDDYKDAWFVGYIPQLATSAWVGYERPAAMENVLGVEQVTGGSIPAQLWAAFMGPAVEDLDVAQFRAPPQVDPIDVPRLKDEKAGDVRKKYEEDYTFNVEVRRVRNYRPAGTIVGQKPKPGTSVDPGALLTLRVSDGKGQLPRVPDVIGMPEQRARRVLTDAGYRVQKRTEQRKVKGSSAPDDDGTVVQSNPGAGSRLEPDSVVTITVVEYEVVRRKKPSQEPSPTPSPSPDPVPDPVDPPGRSSQVGFAQVVADPPGDDLRRNGGEYVTLETKNKVVDVSGWTIEYEGGGTLSIGQGYVMAQRSTLDVHTGSGVNRPRRYFNGLDEEVLADDGGVLILRDDRGREVARTEY